MDFLDTAERDYSALFSWLRETGEKLLKSRTVVLSCGVFPLHRVENINNLILFTAIAHDEEKELAVPLALSDIHNNLVEIPTMDDLKIYVSAVFNHTNLFHNVRQQANHELAATLAVMRDKGQPKKAREDAAFLISQAYTEREARYGKLLRMDPLEWKWETVPLA